MRLPLHNIGRGIIMAEQNTIPDAPVIAPYEVVHEKSSLFYPTYERKSDLKQQTHYCPGCGHGIAHKLIAFVRGCAKRNRAV
jgi:hypothetical protein